MLDIHLRGRSHTAAIVDVGVGGASAAICNVFSSGSAEIIASARSKFSLESRTAKQAATQIAGQITEAASAAMQQYTRNAAVERVYIIMHAPWAASRTVYGRVRYEKDTKIHDAEIARLAREILAGASIDHSRLVESSVIRVELNGYPTSDPSGKFAHELSVVALVSECDPALKGSIESAVTKAFPVARVDWRSAMRALTAFARGSKLLDHHFTIIDMGPDTSHIISVRGAMLWEKTVPEGTRTILARVADGKQPDEVLSSLRMLERDAASSEAAGTLQTLCASAEQDMVKPFAEGIGSIASTSRVANNLLLLAHPDLEPWLSRFFSRIDFAQFTTTTLPFIVRTPRDIIPAGTSATAVDNELLADAALFNTEGAAAA